MQHMQENHFEAAEKKCKAKVISLIINDGNRNIMQAVTENHSYFNTKHISEQRANINVFNFYINIIVCTKCIDFITAPGHFTHSKRGKL